MRVLGMISGTSFDAIDLAVADIRFDGDVVVLEPVGESSAAYADELRQAIAEVLPPATTTTKAICQLDTRIGQSFADVARRAIAEYGGVDLAVSHGQTVYHWVEDNRALGTLQLGQPAWIAEATGLPVVADLRSRDLAAGGHGAPLASLLDVLLLRRSDGAGSDLMSASLNLGGIANLTIVSEEPIAFDIGPANALIDAYVEYDTGGAVHADVDGRRGATGQVHDALLKRLLADDYYDRPPPKSTGKEHFNLTYLMRALDDAGGQVAPDDVIATVTELTAVTVAGACRRHGVENVVAAGGGLRNPTLMRRLDARLGGLPIRPIDELGIPSDAKEAYAFALMGFLTVHGLPATVASCTGARHPRVLGAVIPGADGLPPLETGARPPQRLRVETAGAATGGIDAPGSEHRG